MTAMKNTAGPGTARALVLAQSAAPSSVTGTTATTTLASIPIPAGVMGVNGALRLTLNWSTTNNANTKTVAVTLGGTQVYSTGNQSVLSVQTQINIRNRNSQSSQVTSASIVTFGGSGSAVTTTSIDMTQARTLAITGTLGSSSDTLTLEGYTLELLNP
ncbi:hypothetical protein BX589_12077 [Paraburkholderia fungorum]|jgi:hypothetical protein|uniref:hypothetical protein n=1 Tax=Paraburkholderia fungorum TaxID=134537 RepID=UPI000D083694|nr:hypothetical protein [Paraburkholderia fungorum]PRZ51236.1 hypothetical protein BX589_12077 [Paraburkholderia fungorum]